MILGSRCPKRQWMCAGGQLVRMDTYSLAALELHVTAKIKIVFFLT